jgi:hypothetical protein
LSFTTIGHCLPISVVSGEKLPVFLTFVRCITIECIHSNPSSSLINFLYVCVVLGIKLRALAHSGALLLSCAPSSFVLVWFFFFFFETESYHCLCLDWLLMCDPAFTSRVTRIPAVHHHAWLTVWILLRAVSYP